jgi:pSer/pThr/pTyr-binding forkhead associated (FHA) protein
MCDTSQATPSTTRNIATPNSSCIKSTTPFVVGTHGNLTIISKNGADGSSWPLNLLHKSCTIGRDPKCCIEIKKDTVSRNHAKIIIEGDVVYLVHQSKTQVTKINPEQEDEEIISTTGEQVELYDGDVVDIGGRLFRFDG